MQRAFSATSERDGKLDREWYGRKMECSWPRNPVCRVERSSLGTWAPVCSIQKRDTIFRKRCSTIQFLNRWEFKCHSITPAVPPYLPSLKLQCCKNFSSVSWVTKSSDPFIPPESSLVMKMKKPCPLWQVQGDLVSQCCCVKQRPFWLIAPWNFKLKDRWFF